MGALKEDANKLNKYMQKLHDAVVQGSIVQLAQIFKEIKGNDKVFLVNCKYVNTELKETALHVAVQEGHPEIVRYLLQNGANVNETDVNKNTPLHLAVISQNAELADMLSKFNAKTKLKNAKGETAIFLGFLELIQQWQKKSEKLKQEMKRKLENEYYHFSAEDEDDYFEEGEENSEDEDFIFFSYEQRKKFKAHHFKPTEEVKYEAVDHNKIRTLDEEKWIKFKQSTPTIIRFVDIPWPSGDTDNILSLTDAMNIREKKLVIRVAHLRWHPDKFEQMFGKQLHEKEKNKILEKVKEVAQHINGLKSKLTTKQ